MSGYYGSRNQGDDPRDYNRMTWAVALGVFAGGSALIIVWWIIGWILLGAVVNSFTSSAASNSTGPIEEYFSRAEKTPLIQAVQAIPDALPDSQPSSSDYSQVRAESPTGKKLLVQCNDWSRTASKTPTETTQREASRWCDRYRQYVATGSYDR